MLDMLDCFRNAVKGWIGSMFIIQWSSGSFSFEARDTKYLLNSFAMTLRLVDNRIIIMICNNKARIILLYIF